MTKVAWQEGRLVGECTWHGWPAVFLDRPVASLVHTAEFWVHGSSKAPAMHFYANRSPAIVI
jgi:hypothetical protein